MKSFLTGCDFLEYAGRQLHGQFVRLSHAFTPRVATHEFLKVDGAAQEFMGGGADTFRYDLIFYGPKFREQYADCVAFLKSTPKGLLVDPLLGRRRVAVKPFSASLDVSRELDSVTLPVEFASDEVSDGTAPAPTVAVYASTVTDTADQFATAAAKYSTVATIVAAVGAASTAFADAITTAGASAVPDPSLPQKLAAVRASVLAFTAAVGSDPAAQSDADTFQARDLAVRTYAAALAADLALGRTQPALEAFTVPAGISLARLAADRYGGKQARTMADLIRVLNRIPNPALIPAGTLLTLPTV